VREGAAALAEDLPSRRWFGGKSRTVIAVAPVDHAAVPGTRGVLAIFRIEFTDPPAASYCIPLLAAARPGREPPGDALDDPAFCAALVDHMRAGSALGGRAGTFRFRATAGLGEMLPETPAIAARIKGEQSNTSVVFGERAVLKIYRRLEPGPNPELEITEFLTRETPLRVAPRLGGAIEYEHAGGEATTLATLHAFVPNRGDAWSAFAARLGEYFAAAVTGREGGGVDPDRARSLAEADAAEARALGALTGTLHMALAGATAAALAPERIAAVDVARWQEAFAVGLGGSLAALGGGLDALPTDSRELARRVLEAAPALRDAGRALEALVAEPVDKIRVHGDYHLGQVLCTADGFVVVDFEGEPVRPLAERRARACALKDVAGMLRSFTYAARAAALRAAEVANDAGLADRLGPAARAWEARAREAFVGGYLAETAARGARFLPGAEGARDRLLRAFELDKAAYEVGYEIAHRPGWVRIPLEALLDAAAAPAAPGALAPRPADQAFAFVACLELREFVGARAEDERQLADLIEQVPLDSIYYHTHGFFLRHKFLSGLYPNDFASWVAVQLRDQTLGERLAMVDPAEFASLDDLREALAGTIDDHLRRLPSAPRIVSAEPFDFVRSRIVEVPAGPLVRTLEEFRQALLDVDASAIYFHVVEARLRLGRGQNDFAEWIERALGLAALAARVRALNPYTGSLERTRTRLLQLCDDALAAGGGR